MEPAYRAGDRLLVYRWAYWRRPPAEGDAVVLRDPQAPKRRLLKRVLAVHRDAGGATMVEVLGDNAAASRDSREFGPVPAGLVVGRVWRRY
jgi:signal peptidase I